MNFALSAVIFLKNTVGTVVSETLISHVSIEMLRSLRFTRGVRR